jgi:hypothetical protein
LSLLVGFGYGYSLARCQAVSLNDYGHILLFNEFSGFFIGIEAGTSGAGDIIFLHQLFGEHLAGLNLGGIFCWAEDMPGPDEEFVGNASGQRCFRADDSQVYPVFTDCPE